MSVTGKIAKPALGVFGNDAAPIIYADYVIAYGVNNGIVQLELGANTLVPGEGSTVKCRPVVTTHLRLSADAAQQIVASITKALDLGAKAASSPEKKN